MLTESKENLLLSIVVPTKNRYETLNVLLETVLSWNSDEFEFIVQDNSDDNSPILDLLIQHKSDIRLKYYYSTSEMSAIENCDLAVKNANGIFVCFLGDDDGVVQQIIDLCKWMKKNKVDAVYCEKAAYTWPDMQHAISINNKKNGALHYNKNFSGNQYLINTLAELKKVIESGGQHLYNLPRLYHGIVSKKCLDQLFLKTNSYFPGPVPDMSNAIGLAPFLEVCYLVETPFVISGHSKKSMSGKNAVRKHQGDIRQEKSLPKNTYELWTPQIPKYWCAPTIWAEATIKACEATGQDSALENFNYSNMYANCFAFSNKRFYGIIFKAMLAHKSSIVGFTYLIVRTLLYLIKITAKRTKIYFSKFTSGTESTKHNSIKEAIAFLEQDIGTL